MTVKPKVLSKKMPWSIDDKGVVIVSDGISVDDMRTIGNLKQIPELAITSLGDFRRQSLTALLAKSIQNMHIPKMWLWCAVKRRAFESILKIKGLQSLDVFLIAGVGKLPAFDMARDLQTLRANSHVSEQDVLQISKSPSIEELGIQGAQLTKRAFVAVLKMPNLKQLDLEGTRFNDDMAALLSSKQQLTHLDLGATRISGIGLSHVCKLRNLTHLDLWATRLVEKDLKKLKQLPNLEYLSLGSAGGKSILDNDQVISLLLSMPKLKNVWLDGLAVTPAQTKLLETHFAKVRISD